jgi:predicted O-methyltransferase YrrM
MNSLKNGIKNLLWKFWMYRGMKSLKEKNASAEKIRRAINETLHKKVGSEEKRWIDKIESIREKFTGNPTPVSIVDFGAGNPQSQRSIDEMAQGITYNSTYGAISLGCKPELWALLLFKLIKEFQPERALELGTCIGISAAYQAASQRLNGKGKLISLEGAEAIAGLAVKNLRDLSLTHAEVICGRFNDSLPDVLNENQPIDYVFIDGHHDEQATVNYYKMLLPFLSPGALLVFDDISWSNGMKQAWSTISRDKNIALAVDLTMLGICVTN